MTTPAIIEAGLRSLTEATRAAVNADALERATPCTEWTVAQVLQHAAEDQIVWAATIRGEQPGGLDPFHPAGLGAADLTALVDRATAQTREAWSAVGSDTLATPLPAGPLPHDQAAALAAMDAMVHAWDATVPLGSPIAIPEEYAAAMQAAAAPVIEPLRSYGVFAGPVPGDSESSADALLRFTGRDPLRAID